MMNFEDKIPANKQLTADEKIAKKQSAVSDNKTKKLAITGLFIAMNLVLNQVTIPLGTTMEIGFAFLPIALIGYLFGPVMAGISAVIADILGFIFRPAGFFFPGFTLNAFISGVIYGLFLHRKKITLLRVALLRLVNTVLITLILTPIWLYIMYETPLVTIPRIIKAVVKYPIDVALLYFVLVAFVKIIERQKTKI